MRRLILFIVSLSLVIVSAACYHSGGEIMYTPPLTNKYPPKPETNTIVRVGAYVDTSRPGDEVQGILEAIDRYTIWPAKNRTAVPYFDYVILSGGEMKQGSVTAYLELTGELKTILRQKSALIKTLRDKGIKVMLGVTGGRDGISFGCLPGVEEKNQEVIAQKAFARYVVEACKYYQLEGVEFWDNDGEREGQNPYPEAGSRFFNGVETIDILPGDQGTAQKYWEIGGGNMADLLSFVIEEFGAAGSFQGEQSLDQKDFTPVLVRETLYGRWLPKNVPRYDFSSTTDCFSVLVHDGMDEFGWEDTGEPNEYMSKFIITNNYAPVIIDLAAITEEQLEYVSERLGTRYWGSYEDILPLPDGDGIDDDGVTPIPGDSPYGLVYYTNLGPHSSRQLNDLCVTSVEVFGTEVTYGDL